MDRVVVRNATCTRDSVSIKERHNERKNDSYTNEDIIQNRKHLNINFKECSTTYLKEFDRLCDDKIISLRGLKKDAKIIDEMVFDVNSNYFELNGGYDYAKKFFEDVYKFAIEEIGSEDYILSAVMHADELNKSLTKEKGKDIYHYHLHVVYIPVVEKEILWSKRCKNKELVGTLKEKINQVSHSKKWKSDRYVDENGKVQLEPSYSKLQDRFFDYMSTVGYNNVERGERKSTSKHLSVIEFKKEKEEQQLLKLELEVKNQEEALEIIKNKKSSIKNIEDIKVKDKLFDKSNVILKKDDFEEIKLLAEKQIINDSQNKKIKKELKELKVENLNLTTENIKQKEELSQYKSITSKLQLSSLERDKSKLKNDLDKAMTFIKEVNLEDDFAIYKKSKNKINMKNNNYR